LQSARAGRHLDFARISWLLVALAGVAVHINIYYGRYL
jgi:hypothetical protein